jgi:plasmid maintenance system antidote protein VapI
MKGYSSPWTNLDPLGTDRCGLLGIEVIKGKRAVTTDTALRLARLLGTSPEFWVGLQQDWEHWHAIRSPAAKAIERLEPLRATA